MKVLSLFSGIGAFEKALDNLGKEYELVGFSEIYKFAVKSYCAIHGVEETMNLGDITKINEKELPKNIDLVTYGFPCQDISLAGKQRGLFNEDGTHTRSGLFFEALRIIEETKPKIAIAENVKNLTGKKFSGQFKIVLESLNQAGYNNYWKVLNAKDYGVPQNRERVFIISIRKDIDTGKFEFPEKFELTKKLKDVLETEVDEKYYKTETALKGFVEHAKKQREKGNSFVATFKTPDGVSSTITARYYKDGSDCLLKVKEATKKGYAEAYEGDSINFEQPNSKTRRGRVGKGVAQTLTTSCNQAVIELSEPNVLTPKRTEYGKRIRKAYESGEVKISRHDMTVLVPRTDGISNTLTTVLKDNYVCEPVICASRGRNPDNPSSRVAGEPTKQRIEINKKGLSNTITTVQKDNYALELTLRIRKLTPKECFRLMGFSDSDFGKAESINSNTQLYKQAGNSIVVDVLMYIFNQIYKAGLLEE